MADKNPYLDTVTSIFGDDGDAALRDSLAIGIKSNPDSVAKALPIAQSRKIPLDMAERNLPELEADERFKAIPFGKIQKETPMLGDFLRDRENASIAHDDIGYLSAVAKTIGRGFEVGLEGIPDMTAATYDAMKYSTGLPDDAEQPVTVKDRGPQGTQQTFGGYGEAWDRGEGFVNTAGNIGIKLLEDVGQGIASSAPSLVLGGAGAYAGAQVSGPAAPVGALAGGATGAYIGSASQTVGEFYLSLEQAAAEYNADPLNVNKITRKDIARKSMAWGAALAAPDAIVPGKAGGKIANAAGGDFIKDAAMKSLQEIAEQKTVSTVAKEVGKDTLIEAGTEGIQQAGQIVGVNTTVDKDILTRENAIQVLEATLSGAAGGFGISSIGEGVSGTLKVSQGLMQAEKTKQYLSDIKTILADKAGKLPGRSLEKTREYVNMNTENKDMFIDGEAVQTFYQSLAPEDQAAIEAAIPGFTAKMNDAVTSKGDMSINRADYVVYVQPKDTQAWLDDHARLVPEHMSAADAAEYENFMAEMYGSAQEDIQGLEDGEIVQNNFMSQLMQRFGQRIAPSGRTDVARLLSTVQRNLYETLADREGPEGVAVLDRLVRDLEVQRMIPASVAAGIRRDDFDLMIDKLRNSRTGKADVKGAKRSRPPLMAEIIRRGGVARNSPVAMELKAMGLGPKEYPSLYKKGGMKDLDNIARDELEGSLGVSGIFDRAEDYNGYAPRQQILDFLREEAFGNSPVKTQEDMDSDAADAYFDDLDRAIGMTGVDLVNANNAEVKLALERSLQDQVGLNEGDTAFDTAPEQTIEEQADLTPDEQETLAELEAEIETPPAFEPEEKPAPIEEQKAAEAPVVEKPGETIEDFGEKLAGARKEMWQEYRDSLSSELPEDGKDITLSKHFPEPNYDNLIASGVDVKVLAAIKAMRDEIPSKPQKSWKLKQWAGTVKMMRDFSLDMLDRGKTFEKFMNEGQKIAALNTFFNRIELYADLGYPLFTKAKGWDLRQAQYSMYKGVHYSPAKTLWGADRDGRLGEAFETRDEAVNYIRAKLEMEPSGNAKQTKLDIYQVTKTGEIIIGKKVGAGKYLDLKGGFTSVKEARAYLKENEKPLQVLLEKRKDLPPERRSANDPRRGDDYRLGENVSPEKFAKEFGFRGVQFGNYVEQARRATDLNNAYDALLDMANILGVPSEAISLNGSLGLAFGARGKGGKGAPLAHYEPDHVVINLTKAGGPGTLGHEWWHAMDNFFGKQREGATYLTANPSQRKLNRDGSPAEPTIRPEVVDAFKGVMDAISKTDMKKRSKELDKTRTKDYWSTDIEMSARAYEAYLISKAKEKGQANDYLANIVGQEAYDAMMGDSEKSQYPYPTAQEMTESIGPAFDKLFQTLETRQTDKGTELFQGEGNDPRGSITFTATGRAIMRLYEKEDLSTVLHELGHLYWRAMTELAALPSASEQTRKDVDTMRAWVGAKPLTESTEPLTVEQEEKIADGFLAYLREGKAPSADLQTAFGRFKAWMSRLYRGIKDTLPSITPEVKDVFDRMLATEDAINRVRGQPLFELDQAITDLLPKAEAERMQRKMDKAVEEAKARLLKQALKQAEKRNTAVYREAQAELQAEFAEVVDSQQVYKAMQAIRDAKGLSRSMLKKRWGKEILPYMTAHGGLIARSGGMDPDTVANLQGYANGDEMVRAIMAAEPRADAINTRVEEEMLARFGDMMNDGSIEAEAMEKMHNDLREETLVMEMKMLADLAGIAAPSKEGVKAKAIQMMSEMQVKDINANRRLRAENKASFEYGKALGKKDYTKAARAKAQQLLNHHLYRMSVDAQKSIDKSMQQWRRYRRADKKIAAGRIIDTDYVNAIRAVLARYDITVGGLGIFNNMGFDQWMEKVRAENPDAADTLTALIQDATGLSGAQSSQRQAGSRTFTTPAWKNMSWVDFQDLQNAIDGMDELGRDALSMEIGGQRVTARQAAETVADIIRANNKEKDMSKYYQGLMDKSSEFVSGLDRQIVRMEFIIKALEGGKVNGEMAQILFNPIADADRKERDMSQELAEKLKVILDANPNRDRWDQTIFDGATGKGFSIKNIVTIALNMGNESNLDKLLRGHEWTLADVQRLVFNNLTKEDMDMVQSIWNLFEGMRPDLERAHKKITRFRMKVIPSKELQTPWGTYEGGYFPIVYDPRRSAMAANNAEASVFENNFAIPSVGKGMTKERTGVARELLLDFDGIVPNHMAKTVHLITHGPAVADINRIIMQPVFEKAIKETAGVQTYQQFKPWLVSVARNSVYDAPVSAIDRVLRHLRVATTSLYLGLSTSTMIKQILGLSTTLASVAKGEMTMGNFLTGMGKYYFDPANASAFAFSKSAEMPLRLRRMNADMATVMAETGRTKNLRGKIMYVGMAGIAYVQMYVVDMPTWMAGYEAGLERHNGNQEQAAKYADAIVRQTQGSGSIKDLASLQRGSEAQKAMTAMFGTYILGVLYPRLRELGFDATNGQAARAAITLLPLLVLPALMEGMISDPPEDDEDFLKWLLLKTAVSGTGAIPLVGPIAKGVVDGRDFQATAIEGPISMVMQGMSSDDPDKFMKGLVMATGLATQLPIYKPYQMVNEIVDQASGDEPVAPGEIFLGRRDQK